ncbi:uncharacterized protein [Temnothorax nylanderi]|uniref:uncharacterized protein n=1 Tax=Temnothorax nylanderi TaxID=102681 RepID=UPI003A86DF73
MAYRTVSYEAATLLARIPPIHLYAEYMRRTYLRLRNMKEEGTYNDVSAAAVRLEEWEELRRRWGAYIRDPRLPGRRTREAISPHFEDWLDRGSGFLTFRITQFLTGHGCFGLFGAYLHRIKKEDTPVCRYCNTEEDTPEHTLAVCGFWGLERGELIAVVGQDLSLSNVIRSICSTRKAWNAFSVFAEKSPPTQRGGWAQKTGGSSESGT